MTRPFRLRAARLDFAAAAILRDQLFELKGGDARPRRTGTLRERIGLEEG